MTNLKPGTSPEDFIWASGIEDTFIPQTKKGYRALDEYELMGHYDHWREDLALARQLGVQALRWGVPWYRVEPEPGLFDWRWTDEVIPYLVEELGITPIIDLMHYGCPLWMERPFVDESYPQAVAAYAAAFARRYRHLVRWYTPLNESLINAFMCGRRGVWPPYLRGDKGYVRVMMQLVKGIRQTVLAIQEVDEQAIMVHVEAVGLSHTESSALESLVLEDRHHQYLSFDLLTGRVTPEHYFFTWLLRNGAHLRDLKMLMETPLTINVMGLNFYPQWGKKEVYVNKKGHVSYRIVQKEGHGFGQMLEEYYERYGVPLMITETSAKGTMEVRSRWLDSSLAAIKALRGRGIPILGYTWFPMFTMIDWRYRTGRRPKEAYQIDLGLFTLDDDSGSRWRPLPLVEKFCSYTQRPQEIIGPLNEPGAMDL